MRREAYFQLVSLVLVGEEVGAAERYVVCKSSMIAIDLVSICTLNDLLAAS